MPTVLHSFSELLKPGRGRSHRLVHGRANLRRGHENVLFADQLEHPGLGELIAQRLVHADQHQPALMRVQRLGIALQDRHKGAPDLAFAAQPDGHHGVRGLVNGWEDRLQVLGCGKKQAAVDLQQGELVRGHLLGRRLFQRKPGRLQHPLA